MSRGASPPTTKASLARRTFRVLLLLGAAYVIIALLVMFFQRRLIYFPTRLAEPQAESAAVKEGFLSWRNAAGQIIGWHLPASSTSTGAVLIVHGNAGCALNRGYLAKPIHEAGSLDVYVLEYPGYGARAGAPSEQSLLAAAEEAFALLTNRAPIYVVSESLGAGVAAHLAGKHSAQITGLMLFAPYNDLVAVAQRQFKFLPVGWLLWDRFNPSQSLKNYRGPVGVVLAGADEIIPPEFGRRLHDDYAGSKRLQVFPGAGHNDVASQPPEWWREVFKFWRENSGAVNTRRREN